MRQRLLLLCICVGSYLLSIAQPANNTCGSAIPITNLDGTCTLALDITGATEDVGSGGCTVGANENVWFNFVADGVSAEIVVSNVIGTPEITVVQFPGTPCDPGNVTEIACNTGSPLIIDNLLVEGQTYYVMVAFSNNADGLFDICIDNPDPVYNDACANAQVINTLDGTCFAYNNDFPSTDGPLPGCFTGSTYNVWFSFVAVGVSLDAHVPSGPGVAQLAVLDFTGANCNSAATELGCATGSNHVIVDGQLVIGQTYYIIVGFQNTDFNGNGIGQFEICVDNPIPAPNDDCMDAIVIPTSVLNDPTTCFSSIAGNPLNNDWPSTDVAEFGCWNADDSYNIWYSFVAQGPDVEILVDPTFPEDAEIALVEFNGTPCQFATIGVLECANGTVLDYNDQLVIGNTYYIAVGFEDNEIGDFCMNVFNPVPPVNDLPCDAIALSTNGNCMDGTTIYANPENYSIPGACQNAYDNMVWYTLTMADPDNVGFEIDLSLDDIGPQTHVSVILWEITDCNQPGPIAHFYCGLPPTEPIEFGPVDESITYYLSIGTNEPFETDFEICVDEIPPCFTNDICEEATPIPNVMSDAAFVCVEGCNLYADPETFTNQCDIGIFSTVWFQVQTDGNATLLNIQVTSEDFAAPTISLFHQITDCSDLQAIGLTQSNLSCVVGSNGEAEALSTDVGSSEIYYIAVSSLNNVGGEFEICVNTISVASACVLSRDIEITSRSSGGPLDGPFFPGETVGVCMNVNSYTPVGNGCQWFQGIVPVFGNGWDPSSFDGEGQPLNATINGNNMGVPGNGVYGSTFDWFVDVGYHHTNVFFQIGDLDGNGTVDMCNILYDPDCPDLGGITGGCCGPCWDDPGDILPGGWFAYGINGSCGTPGPPISVDWGDGNSCSSPMGPWNFCFELTVRDYPDCLDDNTTMDLSLGFFTFADGETGSWTGGASVCALDQPAKISLPMCCSELATDNDELDPICSGNVISYVIDQPGVDYWQWTVDPGSVTGATGGEGGPGSLIINTLVNPGADPEIVEYTFLGFAGGACPVFEHTVTVEVFPQIDVELDPLVLCATPTTPYVITPEVTGGSGNYEYLWTPGNLMTPSITVANPVNGTTYKVTVNDDVGCFNTATMTISVYSTFPVDIVAPIVEQCAQDGPLTLDGVVSGGMDPYDFLWTYPGGNTSTLDGITSDQSGEHLLVVTDDEGCVGKDSIDLIFNETPEIYVDAVDGALAICEGESTLLSGVASEGESPYYYTWDTPDGPNDGKTIEAFTPGMYTVTVEDNNGCTNSADIAIEAQPEPQPDLGPDELVCNFDYPVELQTSEPFEDYQWSIGAQGDGLPSIGVSLIGTYTVTVTNEFGCTGTDDIEIELYPEPAFEMPDTFEMCAGTSLTIDIDDFGGPWDNFIWDDCNSCINLVTFTGPGVDGVTVFDFNGCTAYQEFEVVETASLDPALTGPDVICSGNTVTLTASPVFQDYTWSPNAGGATSNSINVTAPGTYIVTVADDEGCSGIDSITVTSGDISVAISGPTAICANVLATLDAGPNYTTYDWSNGGSTQSIQVEEGTYSVTVTSTDGCTATSSITVIETPFVPQITGDDMICQTSETSVLDAGGPYANYTWSPNANNATSQTVTVSTPGTYSVTITDQSGCVGTASFAVGNHPVPFVGVTGDPDFCVGGNTQLSATTGYPNYAWSNSGNTETITINTAGNYTVTVTDANGCTNTASAVVNPPFQETVTITGSFVFCPGGQATLAVPPIYSSVTWSTGETTNQITVTTEGTFTVTVVDSDGCIASDDVVTDENTQLLPSITGDTAICDNGSATLDAGAGFTGYNWSNGEITQMITVNSANTYTVTVTQGGCSGMDDFEVSGYTSPFATVASNATACNVQEPGGPTTIINFDALITAGDDTGNWVQASGPSSVNLANLASVNFNGLTPGNYTFTYTTNSAVEPCTESTYNLSVLVTDCACPSVEIGLAPDLCNDLGTISLNSILIPGTVTPGTWTIIGTPPGSTNPAVITGGDLFDASTADPGTYTVQYSVSGLPAYCQNIVTTTIEVLKTPVAGTADLPAQFCAGENQTVTLASLIIGEDGGGSWNESSVVPSTGNAFDPVTGRFNTSGQAAGTYTFDYTIAGAGPCPDDVVTVQVVIEDNPVADAGSTATLDCDETTTILGGPGSSTGQDIEYTWTTIDGSVSLENQLNAIASKKGTYVLTVLNTKTGCSATDEVFIDQIGEFPTDIDLLVQSPDCEGDPPGSAQVSAVVGGTEPYTYSLNGGAPVSSPVFSNLPAGDYVLEVTDASGCELSESFTIEDLVVVDLEIINYVNDTFIFAFGDTIRLSYLFSGTSSIPDSAVWKFNDSIVCTNCAIFEMQADVAGKITLEAYDARGCFISRSINFIVVRDRDIYIPNIFSPNDDFVNDYFTLFTDADLKEISLMEVYTRWGDLVFRRANFQPNIPEDGWDGTFKGERLNPGVYVYRIEIIYGDDLKETVFGDITIIR